MSRSGQSVLVFSIYLLVMGSILVAIPNLLLSVLRIPETTEVWVRVVGMLVLILGFYYNIAARNELRPFIRATVYGRLSVLFFFIAFVFLGYGPPILLVFGFVDALAATWTAMALRTERPPR